MRGERERRGGGSQEREEGEQEGGGRVKVGKRDTEKERKKGEREYYMSTPNHHPVCSLQTP